MEERPVSNPVTFASADIELVGVLGYPPGDGPFPAAVICHPHSLYGGNMHNNVVMAIYEALLARSIAALRFNFRGVGGSQGSFGDGIGERDDVRAALTYLEAQEAVDGSRLGLAGYSFGAGVALPVAPSDSRVAALAAVSPPTGRIDSESLQTFGGPKFFACGSNDQFSDSTILRHFVARLPDPKEFYEEPRTDHFWWGYEPSLAQRVADFMAEALGVTEPS